MRSVKKMKTLFNLKKSVDKRFWSGKAVIVFGLAMLMNSCSVALKWPNMKLGYVSVPGQLANLQNATAGLDPELVYEVDKIMSSYVDTRAEQMGYYTVNFTYKAAATGGGLALAFVSGFTLFSYNLMGMPFQITKFNVSAYLSIFDSQGNLVETFRKTGDFKMTSGFYYGHDATKKAGVKYTELFRDLLQQANMKSRTINDLLHEAGPVTVQNSAAAKTKITQIKIP